MPQKKNLLLIGASGRVGSMVSHAWNKHQPDEFTVISQFRRTPPNHHAQNIEWDVEKESEPPAAVKSARPAYMIVMAGVTPTTPGGLDANADIAVAWLQAAKALGVKRVLVASSSAVYEPGEGTLLNENSPLASANDYGRAKIAMEQAVAQYRTDIEVCCLRIGNVLGADALIMNGADATKENPLQLDRFASGGGPVRSYIDPVTLSEVLHSLVTRQKPLPDIVNVACVQPTSMQSIADAAQIPWQWKPAGPNANERIALDCSILADIHAFNEQDGDPARMVHRLNMITSNR